MRDRIPLPFRLALSGAFSIGAAIGVGRFIFTPILPPMIADLHLTASQSGWIATANFLGYLVGALVAAAPVFAKTPRFWLILGLGLSAFSTGLMGLASSVPWFLVLRAIGGIASAFVLVFASTLVLQRLAREDRSELSALHFAGVGCAVVLSSLIVLGSDAVGVGWRAMWLSGGALSGLALLATVWLLPKPTPPSRKTTPIAERQAGKGAWSLMAAYGLFGFGYVVTATFIVVIVKTYSAARPVAPFVWLLFGLAAVPSVWLWTVAGQKVGVRRAFSIACAVEALGVAVSVLRPTVDGVVIAALLLGGTFMGITALGLVAARETAPKNAAKVIGRMTGAFGLGQMVGPALAGWLAERLGGFAAPSLIGSAALLLAAGLTIRKPR